MDSVALNRSAALLRSELLAARAHTDALFALVAPPTLYERPIPDRHRLIFYLGHFDAFDWWDPLESTCRHASLSIL